MTTLPSPEAHVAFFGNLERLLAEGQYVATYKYALLIALADLAVKQGHDDDRELELSVADIAVKFVELYWRQATPYRFGTADGPCGVLAQNAAQQAAIISIVDRLNRLHRGSFAAARSSAAWPRVVERVQRLLQQMPLWRLQTLRGGVLEFLYENSPGADRIMLKPGVAASFRRFHGLVLRLAQAEWLAMIRSLQANQGIIGPASDLTAFLFGTQRRDLGSARDRLASLQSGRCFYCDSRLHDAGAVDHFIPWSRYPRDLAHNFVVARGKCNSRKSDLLTGTLFLEAWVDRNRRHDADLQEIGVGAGLIVDHPTTLRIARWSYEHDDSLGAQVWLGGEEYGPLESSWRRALEVVGA